MIIDQAVVIIVYPVVRNLPGIDENVVGQVRMLIVYARSMMPTMTMTLSPGDCQRWGLD